MDGRDRRDTSPPSERTAAWGDPPVRLRCGVRPPRGLTAESEVVEVDGVEWFLAEPAPPYLLATVGRATVVEVLVPPDTPRSEVTAPLVDLAPAVKTAIPPG